MEASEIPQAVAAEGFRLSPQQKHAWLLQQGQGPSPYRVQCALLLTGPLRREALRSAFESVVRGNEIFRTTFHLLEGATIPVQVITEGHPVSFEERALDAAIPGEEEFWIEDLLRELSGRAFSLERGPGLHVLLAALSPARHILVLGLSSLVADRATLALLIGKIGAAYTATLRGEALPDEPLQYADLAEWQNQQLEHEDGRSGREYWGVAGPDPADLGLAFELPAVEEAEFQPRCVGVGMEPALAAEVEALARSQGVAPSTVLLACWQVLLWRLTGKAESIMGLGSDGREHPELQTALGPFFRYLPLRARIEEGLRLSDVVRGVVDAAAEAVRWQDFFSWDHLTKPLATSKGAPFFAVCFDSVREQEAFAAGDVSFAIRRIDACPERFAVRLSCVQGPDAMAAELHYDALRLREDDVRLLAARLRALLRSAIDRPECVVGELEVLDESERCRVLFAFNETRAELPEHRCIHEVIDEQAKRTPAAVAVACGDESLSYAQLKERSNNVAHDLRRRGVGPDVLVAICAERSLELIVGLLGILKAGGAYVPLDPAYPRERLDFMLKDSGAAFVLTQRHLAEGFAGRGAPVVSLDGNGEAVAQEGAERPAAAVGPGNLAYVIYTSGSTGRPKGVLVTHANLVQSTHARFLQYPEKIKSYLLLSSFAFDSSVAGIFWTLAQGGTLVLPQEGLERDPAPLIDLICRRSVSHMLSLPSLYALVLAQAPPERLSSLRTVIVAGESCTRDLVERHVERAPGVSLFNEYGPTEATVWTTVYECKREGFGAHVPPIGRPIANTQVYILDPLRQPVPIGVPGEIYIGGLGLARGYLRKPELTAEKFVPDPFGGEKGARLYRTGDLARWVPDGNVEFLGRVDQQVKIRGYRIELEEVEAVLKQHPRLVDVVVDARSDHEVPEDGSGSAGVPAGQKRLVAYAIAIPGPRPTVGDLRSFLQARLPEYMVPSAFVFLDSFPVNPNGKVDRKALPAPDSSRPELGTRLVAPRNPVEAVLAATWSELLGLEQIGIHDNFFELGGHSILATQLVSRVRDAFRVSVPLRALFEAPTVAGLAAAVLRDPAERARVERTAQVLLKVSGLSEAEVEAILDEPGPSPDQ